MAFYVYADDGALIATCLTLNGAINRADDLADEGRDEILVYDESGEVVYEPEGPVLFDEC